MPTNTVTTSGLATIAPEIAPYYTGAGITGAGLLPKAQEIYAKGYEEQIGAPLTASGLAGAGRVAPLSPMQQQIGTELAGMQAPGQFAQGTQAVGQAQDMYSNLGTISPEQLQQYQLGQAQTFGADQAAQYMSPYQQNVTDYAKDQALRDAQMRSVAQNLGAARQGTYGGARSLLAQTELDRNLQSQLQGLQYKGSQDAYTNAQQQFERDRAAGYQTNLANQQAQLGVQQLGSAQSLEAQRANQAAQLQAASGLTTAGQALGQLGTAQQATDIDRIKTQGAYGDLERALSQQGIDARYQDLLQQMNYPKEQLAGMQGILTGVPIANQSSTQTTQTPAPSFASQLTGAGLTGLGLYNMFAGK